MEAPPEPQSDQPRPTAAPQRPEEADGEDEGEEDVEDEDLQQVEERPSLTSSISSASAAASGARKAEVDVLYAQIISMDAQLRARDEELRRVSAHARALEAQAAQSSADAEALREELGDSQARARTFADSIGASEARRRELDLESLALSRALREHVESVKALQKQAATTQSPELLPAEFYKLVIELESQLAEAHKSQGALREEARRIEALLKQSEASATRERTEAARKLEAALAGRQAPIVLENRVQDLTRQLAEVLEENRLLSSVQRVKTQAIEELTAQLAQRESTREDVAQLRGELREKEQAVATLVEENTKLVRLVQDREERLDAVGKRKPGISMELWMGEREYLKSEVARYREANAALETTNRRQQDYIAKLRDRIALAGTLKSTRGLRGTPPASPARTSAVAAIPTPGASLGQVLGVPQELNGHDDMVPAPLYARLEDEVRRLREQLRLKDTAIAERDEIAMLQSRGMGSTALSASRRTPSSTSTKLAGTMSPSPHKRNTSQPFK